MSIVTTFENQCRALTSIVGPDENASRFLVGTLSPNVDNLLYLFEYKDDSNSLAKVSYKFPYGECWHLSTSSKYPNIVSSVVGNRGKLGVNLIKLPDEVNNPIEDDYGLSESKLDKIYEPIEGVARSLVRQSHWHPDEGHQLLTCNDGQLDFWDINQQTHMQSFSLLDAAKKFLDLESASKKPAYISDLRWSSLFNCSVVAAAIGSKIFGIDTRIPKSSPASICWLIEDQRCNKVRTIDFNPNSQYYIASGGDDCRSNFWDLRQTSSPVLNMQAHTHWIWSIRYNPFHDQLVLSSGSDARVVLMRAQSIASEPYGQLADDENEDDDCNEDNDDDDEQDKSIEIDKSSTGKVEIKDPGDSNKQADQISADRQMNESTVKISPETRSLRDEVINMYEEHDDSVYAAEWASDPWIFASLGFESRLVINKVPKAEKFNILF